jgi:multidrug resistance efflux pump
MDFDTFLHDSMNKLSPVLSTQPHDRLLRLQRDKYRQGVAELRTQIVRFQAQVEESECTIEDLRCLLAEAQNDAVVNQDDIWRSTYHLD